MLKTYQRSIAFFLSLLIAFQSISCPGWFYMNYDMLFDRDIVFHQAKNNKTYNAWYYNQELYASENTRFQNADSWVEFLEGAYSRKAILSFIYREEVAFGSRDKELLSLRKNRNKALISPQKETQFVDCIIFALKVEKLMENYQPDPWEEEPMKINLADFSPLISQAKAQILAIQDPFLKERYAFQLIKLYRYSKQYSECTTVFKEHFKGRLSMISLWAMEHYAGVLSETKRTAEANYYFAKVYVNCPSKRRSAYLSMKLASASDFARTLSYCVNDEQRMALYYIHAMKTKSLALVDLQEITKTLGNHEYARVVMSHEINKLEKILQKKAKTDEEFEYQGDRMKELQLVKRQVPAYLEELITLTQNMALQNDEDAFWKLSLAYLYYLDHRHDACATTLKTIQPTNDDTQKQHDIIFIINYLEMHPTLNEEDETILGNKLYSLNENNPNYPFLGYDSMPLDRYQNEESLIDEYNTANEFIFQKIAERYKVSNSFVSTIFSGNVFADLRQKSALATDVKQSHSQFQVTLADIDHLLADLKRTPETKLSLFAASYYFQTPSDTYSEEERKLPTLPFHFCEQQLLELKATILMRNPATIDQALKIYNTLPAQITQQYVVYGSPFTYSSKTPHFSRHDEIQNRLPKMTRMEFAQNVKRLSSQPMTSENAFELGMAYYNASYYGLQWQLLAYYRPYSRPDGNVDMSIAWNYLKTALSLGGLTRERQAQAYFMLARCEQNRYTLLNGEIPENYMYNKYFDAYFNEMKGSRNMRNFEILASNYAGTACYQEIIRECHYFDYYLN
jgi:hypothetical protein